MYNNKFFLYKLKILVIDGLGYYRSDSNKVQYFVGNMVEWLGTP